jgi:hypothetical protein
MLKQIKDRYWSWKRRRAEQTLNDAYRRTAPVGQPLSADLAINNYYAKLREKKPMQTLAQRAALKVQEETLARAKDPAQTSRYRGTLRPRWRRQYRPL